MVARVIPEASPDPAKPNAMARRKSVVADFEMAIAEELMKGAGEKTSARSLESVSQSCYHCKKMLDP
jgi:hypothetical protein